MVDPPRRHLCAKGPTIGLDIAKHVFQVHGADGVGHVLFRKRITRVKLLGFLAEVDPDRETAGAAS